MSSNEVWTTCEDCGTELQRSDSQCPKCGYVRKPFVKIMSEQVGIRDGTIGRQKRKGVKKFLWEAIDRWRSRGDPKLEKGVHEVRIIDKGKDEYHHVIKDVKTGKITHEEHEPLSKHNKKGG